MTKLSRHPVSHVALAFALTGALAACGRSGAKPNATAPLAALPLTDAPAPLTPAPATSALPRTGPGRVARLRDPREAYAYIDRAYAQGSAYGDAPPDYTFDYDGVRPWVWRADDDARRYAEPLPGGGYRYFYYEPGAAAPYFVQDGAYGYGYSGGGLSVVYGPGGRVMPPAYVDARTAEAGALLARAESIYAASRRADRLAVARANWDARRSEIAAQRADWSRQQAQDDAWRAYHDAHQADYQAHWNVERERREAEAASFAQTQDHPVEARRDPQAAQRAAAETAATAAAVHRQDQALQRQQADQARLQAEQGHLQAQQAQLQRQEAGRLGGSYPQQGSGPPPFAASGAGLAQHPGGARTAPREGSAARQAQVQARPTAQADRPPQQAQAQALRAAEAQRAQQLKVQEAQARRARQAADAQHAQALQAASAQRAQALQQHTQARQAAEAQHAQAAQARQTEQAQARQVAEAQHAQAAQTRQAEQVQRAQQAQGAREAQSRQADQAQHAREHAERAQAHVQAAAHAPPAAAAPRPGGGVRPGEGRDRHDESR